MRKAYVRLLYLLPILLAGPACGAQQIKNIKVVVSNPSSTARSAADIVIPIAEIRRGAPDFKPGALIVTVSDASTLEEDAAVLQTEELPSQVDDLDGDGKADELAFQVDLAAHQSRIVTISYGDGNRIWRLRSDYKQRTAALFSRKIFRLSTITTDPVRASRYRDAGARIVQSMIDCYLTPVGADDHTPPGVLRHGSSTHPNDAMLIYGQYYLLEDLLWLEQHKRRTSMATK
jgi:hypothetical protein